MLKMFYTADAGPATSPGVPERYGRFAALAAAFSKLCLNIFC